MTGEPDGICDARIQNHPGISHQTIMSPADAG